MDTSKIIEELERRLRRLETRQKTLRIHVEGNEDKFTFYKGYSLGYVEGKIAEIENLIDLLQSL